MPSGWVNVAVSPLVETSEQGFSARGGPAKQTASWTAPGAVTRTVDERMAHMVEPVTSQ